MLFALHLSLTVVDTWCCFVLHLSLTVGVGHLVLFLTVGFTSEILTVGLDTWCCFVLHLSLTVWTLGVALFYMTV